MIWELLTTEQKLKAVNYLDGLSVVLGHEPDADEFKKYWNELTEDEQEEIIQ